MPSPVPIVIVERNGDLRASHMNAYTPSELRKKCKCKPSSKFEMHAEWAYDNGGTTDERFIVELWACDDGIAGQENKYEFQKICGHIHKILYPRFFLIYKKLFLDFGAASQRVFI